MPKMNKTSAVANTEPKKPSPPVRVAAFTSATVSTAIEVRALRDQVSRLEKSVLSLKKNAANAEESKTLQTRVEFARPENNVEVLAALREQVKGLQQSVTELKSAGSAAAAAQTPSPAVLALREQVKGLQQSVTELKSAESNAAAAQTPSPAVLALRSQVKGLQQSLTELKSAGSAAGPRAICWATALQDISVYATPEEATAGGKPSAKTNVLRIVRGERCRVEVPLAVLQGDKRASKNTLVTCHRLATFGTPKRTRSSLVRVYTRVTAERMSESFGSLSLVPGNLSNHLRTPAPTAAVAREGAQAQTASPQTAAAAGEN